MRVIAWLFVVLAYTRVAHAEPDIVIVETRDAPALPTLASQIQGFVEGSSVVAMPARDADPLTFGERAGELIAAGTASVVVWIAPVEHGVVVFVAGKASDRALLQRVRIDAALGAPEIERTIALKIASLLDEMLVQRAPIAVVLDVPIATRASWRIEVGGGVAIDAHERGADGRAQLAVARGWTRNGWTLTPSIGGYWQPSGAIAGALGTASVTELAAVLAVEVAREVGPLELAVRPRGIAGVLLARGTSRDGRTGAATLFEPAVGLELVARRAIAPAVAIGIATGSDFALIRRGLAIDGEPIVDLGRSHLHVGLTLTVGL